MSKCLITNLTKEQYKTVKQTRLFGVIITINNTIGMNKLDEDGRNMQTLCGTKIEKTC